MRYPSSHYWIRRFFFYYIFFVILGLQLVFLCSITWKSLHFPILEMVFALAGGLTFPLAGIAVWIQRRLGLEGICRVHWKYWGVLSLVMFGLWAGGYFLSGVLVDPTHVRYIHSSLDKAIPFDYRWITLYLTVYPLFLLPFFILNSKKEIFSLTFSYIFMLGVSYVVFVLVPVSFHRETTVKTVDFVSWLLNTVYGADPPWNCLPSTHCGVAMVSALALWKGTNFKLGLWSMFTAILIGISTLFTKQHYIIDVIAGYALGAITYVAVKRVIEILLLEEFGAS